jgi:hypothetical protein
MQVGVAGVLVVAMRQKVFLLFSACVLLTCVFIIMLPATTRQHGLKTIVKVSIYLCVKCRSSSTRQHGLKTMVSFYLCVEC